MECLDSTTRFNKMFIRHLSCTCFRTPHKTSPTQSVMMSGIDWCVRRAADSFRFFRLQQQSSTQQMQKNEQSQWKFSVCCLQTTTTADVRCRSHHRMCAFPCSTTSKHIKSLLTCETASSTRSAASKNLLRSSPPALLVPRSFIL